MKCEYFHLQYLYVCPWHNVNTGKVYSCQYWCIVFKNAHKLSRCFWLCCSMSSAQMSMLKAMISFLYNVICIQKCFTIYVIVFIVNVIMFVIIGSLLFIWGKRWILMSHIILVLFNNNKLFETNTVFCLTMWNSTVKCFWSIVLRFECLEQK